MPQGRSLGISRPREDAVALNYCPEALCRVLAWSTWTAHVLDHISPPFAFQRLRLWHTGGKAILHLLPSYFTRWEVLTSGYKHVELLDRGACTVTDL